jgi:antitoxin component YwqK of YwqJK toxin-antitoxin module
VSAKTVPISKTGYTLDIPDDFNISQPDNAPNILLNCLSPGGEASIQVIQAAAGISDEDLATDYENKMRQALQNLEQVGSDKKKVAGRPTLFRRYKASDGKVRVRILALFYTSPKQAFVLHSIDRKGDAKMLRSALLSLQSPRKAAAKPQSTASDKAAPADVVSRTDGSPTKENAGVFQYLTLSIDDSGLEFLYPQHFRRFQQSEGQSQWADPNAGGSKVVMVVQTMMRSAGNTGKSVFEGLVSQVRGSDAAKLLSNKPTKVNGMPGYTLHFTLQQPTQLTHFQYLVLDLPGPNVAAISFVGPDQLLDEINLHYEQLLKSATAMKSSDRGSNIEPAATGNVRAESTDNLSAPAISSVSSVDFNQFPIFTPYTWNNIPRSLSARPDVSAFPLPQYDSMEEKSASGGRIVKEYKKGGKIVATQSYEGALCRGLAIMRPDGKGRVYVEFWRDGSVSNVDYYEGMYKQGVCRFWDTDGTLAKISTYRDNKPDGAEVSWLREKNHLLSRVEHTMKGVRHGLLRTYYRTGQIEQESHWENGVEMKQTFYFASGKVRSELTNKDGKLVGTQYLEDGSAKRVEY